MNALLSDLIEDIVYSWTWNPDPVMTGSNRAFLRGLAQAFRSDEIGEYPVTMSNMERNSYREGFEKGREAIREAR